MIDKSSSVFFSHFTIVFVVVNYFFTIKMASINYCFTVCRAAEEKAQQDHHSHNSSSNIEIPQSTSPGTGAYFFGRFFSFGSTPSFTNSILTNPFALRASETTDDNNNA